MSKKNEEKVDSIGNVEQALSRTEQFIENNQKKIIFLLLAVVVLVLGYFGYLNYIHKPKVAEAASAMYQAERYFEQDSMKLALYGDGNNFGFLYIIDEYGSTPSANLAHFYAGVAFLNLGDYDKSIEYLKSFSSDDLIISSLAKGALGDAYVQKGDLVKGAQYYVKAANNKKDNFNTPMFLMKAGNTFEELGQYSDALGVYKEIQNNFGDSREGRTIEKYISRVELLKQ